MTNEELYQEEQRQLLKDIKQAIGSSSYKGYIPRGAHEIKREYNPHDLVYYNGKSYICVKQVTGDTPDVSESFVLFADRGEKGEKGEKGETGQQGIQGFPGRDGEDSKPLDVANILKTDKIFIAKAKGPQGDRGPQGPQGKQGPKGDKGDPGEDGLSAYQIWLNKGNKGSEQDFLNSLKGISNYIPGAGSRVPNGGSTGQVLAKASDNNQDLEWVNPEAQDLWERNTYFSSYPFLQTRTNTDGLVIGKDLHSTLSGFSTATAFFNGSPPGNGDGAVAYFMNIAYGTSFLTGGLFVGGHTFGTPATPTQNTGSYLTGLTATSYSGTNWEIQNATHILPGFYIKANNAVTTPNGLNATVWMGSVLGDMVSVNTETNAINLNASLLSSTISMWGTGAGFPTFSLLPGGTAALYATANVNNRLLINNYLVANSAAEVQITATSATRKPLILQGYTSQSATIFEAQNASGVLLASIASDGDIEFGKELARTIQILDSTTASAAGGALTIVAGAGSDTSGGTGGALNLTGGAGRSGNSSGGAINITGGTGVGVASGGAVNITGGAHLTGGSVTINGGNGVADGNVRIVNTDGLLLIGHTTSGSALVDIQARASSDALHVDNKALTTNIAVFKDNGTAVVTIADGGVTTFTQDPVIPDEAYGAGWDGILEPPTKNAVYDKIESFNLVGGTYTPILTNGTNVAASTAYQCQYMRVANTITVSGKVDIDMTSTGAYELGVSLPVASNFGATEDCAGIGTGTTGTPSASDVVYIMADTANDRASINGNDNDTANHTHYFTFTYQVI